MISILLDIAIGLGVAAVVCAAIDALISAKQAKLAKNRRARVRQDNETGRAIHHRRARHARRICLHSRAVAHYTVGVTRTKVSDIPRWFDPGGSMYVVGQPYRYAVAMKNGFPVYQMTKVKEIHPEHLVLENDVRICFESVGRLDPDPRLSHR